MPSEEDPTTNEEKEGDFFPALACGDFGCWPYELMTFEEFLAMKAERTETTEEKP